MSEVFSGDCREVLSKLPEGSVHCVVTSPPYYGLRDYGVEPVEWADGWVGCLGLEPSPELYVAHLVECFRAVKRVLRDDGVLWLNLGDSYVSHKPRTKAVLSQSEGFGSYAPAFDAARKAADLRGCGALKDKDLIGVPWQTVLALRADGWYMRSEVIWAKGTSGQKELAGQVAEAMAGEGCGEEQVEGVLKRLDLYVGSSMPESVKDRPIRSHEHLFLLTKSKRYHYDVDAVREMSSANPVSAARRGREDHGAVGTKALRGCAHGQSGKGTNAAHRSGRNRRSVWTITTKPCPWEYCRNCGTLLEGGERKAAKRRGGKRVCPGCGSSDHWVGHFAQFPPDLVEPCILAGTSAAGRCPECGTPFRRVTRRVDKGCDGSQCGESAVRATGGAISGGTERSTLGSSNGKLVGGRETVGWEPTCECAGRSPTLGLDQDGGRTQRLPQTEPCVVLDPFCGAGNAGLVAVRNGLHFIGVDVKPEYVAVAEARLRREGMTDEGVSGGPAGAMSASASRCVVGRK